MGLKRGFLCTVAGYMYFFYFLWQLLSGIPLHNDYRAINNLATYFIVGMPQHRNVYVTCYGGLCHDISYVTTKSSFTTEAITYETVNLFCFKLAKNQRINQQY